MMFESHIGNTEQASESIDISSSPTVSFTVGQNPHERVASKVHRWNDQKTGVVTENPKFQYSGVLTHIHCPLFDMMNPIDSPDKFIVLGVVKGSKPGDHQHLIAHDAESKGELGVSRTKKNFIFPDPALLMVDVDFKDDFCEPAMQVITPDQAVQLLEIVLGISLKGVAMVIKPSASANIVDSNDQPLKQSSGFHIYMALKGCDPETFHKVVHRRLFALGYGHAYVSKSGSVLPRTVFDASVGAPNRVDFAADPQLDEGMFRDAQLRYISGDVLNLADVDMSIDEAAYEKAFAELKRRVATQGHVARRVEVWKENKIREYQGSLPLEEVTQLVEGLSKRLISGDGRVDLYPSDGVEFVFDDGARLSLTALVRRANEFDGESLADPFDDDGVACKAKFYANVNSTSLPVIHSFEGGGVNYHLHSEDLNALDFAMSKLNEEFAVVTVGNKTRIMLHKTDANGRPDFDLLSSNDFKLVLSNRKSPDNSKQSLANFWLNHPLRLTYSGIVFEPNRTIEGYHNLWRGYSVVPIAGVCSLFKEFMLDVICNSDDELFDYLWCWCAYMMQFPDKLPGTAIVLMGGQGTGKNTFVDAIGHLVSDHFLTVNRMSQVTGNFNAHLKNVLLLHANEALWGGVKADAGALKALITDNKIPIEFKGKDIINISNHIHLIISSNEAWPVATDEDDRRFLVLEVSPKHKQDGVYFGRIHDELKNGGYAALLHDLLSVDLQYFDPAKKPLTAKGAELKMRSMDPMQRWLFHCLQAGRIVSADYHGYGYGYGCGWPGHLNKEALYDSFRDWCRSRRIRSDLGFDQFMKLIWKYLGRVCSEAKVSEKMGVTTRRVRMVKFQSLADCRREFENATNAVGLIEWQSVDDDLDSSDDDSVEFSSVTGDLQQWHGSSLSG